MAQTLVVSGKDISGAIAQFQSNIQNSWCACVDSTIPAFSMSDAIKKGYSEAKKRGVRIRYVTDIMPGNLQHCKELMQFAELRHITGIRGSFAVSEGEFVAGISVNGQLKKLIYSDILEVVAHQQDVFETLWQVAVPANLRIRNLT
jgi:lipid II:glycine glycyltransferase (peptidoglycan interpeptide bridge formation enzyme)